MNLKRRCKKWMPLLLVACVAALMLCPEADAGAKLEVGEDAWIELGFLGQVHFAYLDEADKKEDAYIRRARIILSGQVMDGIKFFVETDNDNAGRQGFDASTDIQDAFMDFRILDSDQWIMGGLILLPFSFENASSAASLLGIDYNAEVIFLPNTFVWRDYGAEVHGSFTSRFSYKIGVFEGYDTSNDLSNDNSDLRYAGHLAFNIIGEAETGWFYSQNRFAENDYLSIGAGGNYQKKASLLDGDEIDDTDWVVDFQSGFHIGSQALIVNGGYYDYDNVLYEGNATFGEAGYLIGKVMPTFKISYLDPDEGEDNTDYTYGLGYFFKENNARLGLEYRTGDSPDLVLLGLQFLI